MLALGLSHERILNPIGLAAELQQPSVVDQAGDDGRCHLVVTEHRSPSKKIPGLS
jgi:hypothetical protein